MAEIKKDTSLHKRIRKLEDEVLELKTRLDEREKHPERYYGNYPFIHWNTPWWLQPTLYPSIAPQITWVGDDPNISPVTSTPLLTTFSDTPSFKFTS